MQSDSGSARVHLNSSISSEDRPALCGWVIEHELVGLTAALMRSSSPEGSPQYAGRSGLWWYLNSTTASVVPTPKSSSASFWTTTVGGGGSGVGVIGSTIFTVTMAPLESPESPESVGSVVAGLSG